MLAEYGIPPKIINLIKDLYNGYECQVIHQGDLTDPIRVKTGVREGCILSPVLFLLVLDSVMRRVVGRGKRGI